MSDLPGRNRRMAERIAAAPIRYPFSFVVAGDSGAWPDPTADAIFAQLLRQASALRPPPLFFANLGDFAGPGTPERHERYLQVVQGLPFPDVCVVGNHDLDDRGGADA
jgi:3',5'-cyclic AMP phosphodiesterase CpdA